MVITWRRQIGVELKTSGLQVLQLIRPAVIKARLIAADRISLSRRQDREKVILLAPRRRHTHTHTHGCVSERAQISDALSEDRDPVAVHLPPEPYLDHQIAPIQQGGRIYMSHRGLDTHTKTFLLFPPSPVPDLWRPIINTDANSIPH